MRNTIRIYYSTFIDVELESGDFKSEDEMIDYANANTMTLAEREKEQIAEHLCPQECDTEILDSVTFNGFEDYED